MALSLPKKLCFPTLLFVLFAGCAPAIVKDDITLEMVQLSKNPPTEMLWTGRILTDEKWKIGHSGQQYNVSLTEFVRPPETINNWTELLTIAVHWKTSRTYTHPINTFSVVPSPNAAMKALVNDVQARCGVPLNYKFLDEEKAVDYPSVMFYLACASFKDDSPPEAQVHRMFQGKQALYHLHRIRRSKDLDDIVIDRWVKDMKKTYICDSAIPEHQCVKKN